MTPKPLTVGLHDTLATAAERMWAGDCGCLPVVDDEGGVIAMITDRDICMATWSRNRPPQYIAVPEAMSQSVVVCRSDDTVEDVESAMRSARVRRLPVVDDGKLSGIVSLADIVISKARTEGRQGAGESNGVSSTLAIICQRPVLRSAPADDAPADDAPVQARPSAAMADSRA